MPIRTTFIRPATVINPFDGALATYYKAKTALWAQYYLNRFKNLGPYATLVNFGDRSNFGLETAATGTGMKFEVNGLSPVWTPSSVMSGWATPFNLDAAENWQGDAPVATFNGTSRRISTPDADYWSSGDGSKDSVFSIGAWVNVTDTAARRVIMAKWVSVSGEWRLEVAANDTLTMIFRDPSAGVEVSRSSNAAIAQATWIFVVATYAGTGGATAMNGVTLYVNGVSVASTASNNAAYVAMENGANAPEIGSAEGGDAWWNGKIAGGPFCPFYVPDVVSAEAVANMFSVERLALGV